MFHIFWPAVTALTMFVLMIIIVIIKYGPRLCQTRHTAKPMDYDWEIRAYEQKVSCA